MKLRVEVPEKLRWRCARPDHGEVVETPNPARPPICNVPVSDWVCSTEMVTVEEYERRKKPVREPDIADLPPDAPTGLYLDRPFDVEDLEWIDMAWGALARGGTTVQRPTQLMLIFKAIRRDERATTEFLRLMNTVMLPLLRQIRLKKHPNLAKLGAAGE